MAKEILWRFLGRVFSRYIKEWDNEVSSWTLNDWLHYVEETIKKLLSLSHNAKVYKVSGKDFSLEDLLEKIPIYKEIPTFPKARYFDLIKLTKMFLLTPFKIGSEYSSGTTGTPKELKAYIWDATLGILATRNIIKQVDNLVFVSNNIQRGTTTSYLRGYFLEGIMTGFGKKCIHIPIIDLLERKDHSINRIGKKLDYVESIFSIVGQAGSVIRDLEKVLADEVTLALSGEALSDNIVNYLKTTLENIGSSLKKVVNIYSATELVAVGGVSLDNDWKTIYVELTGQFPVLQIIKRKDNEIEFGKRVFIHKAKKGDMGIGLWTIFRTNILMNYMGLKDLLVVRHPEKYGVEIIGRLEYTAEIDVHGKKIKGITGTIIRVAGLPINMNSLVAYIVNAAKKYTNRETSVFLYIIDKKYSGRIIVIHNNPLVSRFENSIKNDLYNIAKKDVNIAAIYINKGIEIEFKYDKDFIENLYGREFFERSLRGRSPKTIQWIKEDVIK